MKDGDTYRGWKITTHDIAHDWDWSTRRFWEARAMGRRGELSSVFCTRRDNAIRALKRVIDDQEAGREMRLYARKHAALLLAAHSLPTTTHGSVSLYGGLH